MNENEKICPLFDIADSITGCEEDCHCFGKSCAWWCEDAQKCALLVLAETQRKAVKK